MTTSALRSLSPDRPTGSPPRPALTPVRTPEPTPRQGVTAVLRVRNEARSLPRSLPPLLRACTAVVLVDNQSTDGTADVARQVAGALALEHRLTIVEYPHAVRRCGADHLHTPPESPHSLVAYNNWALTHVRTAYAVKWDGDMVLTREGERLLADFVWQVGDTEVILRIARHPLYVESDRVAHLDLGVRNVEHFGLPMQPGFGYVKGLEWEVLRRPAGTPTHTLPSGICLELKHLGEDEFGHWTEPGTFGSSPRTRRKAREYAVFEALGRGGEAPAEGLLRIEAPAGLHVVDHATDQLARLYAARRVGGPDQGV